MWKPQTTGRYKGITYDTRYCEQCNMNEVGDEYHYIFNCPALAQERNAYIKITYRARPSNANLNKLLIPPA